MSEPFWTVQSKAPDDCSPIKHNVEQKSCSVGSRIPQNYRRWWIFVLRYKVEGGEEVWFVTQRWVTKIYPRSHRINLLKPTSAEKETVWFYIKCKPNVLLSLFAIAHIQTKFLDNTLNLMECWWSDDENTFEYHQDYNFRQNLSHRHLSMLLCVHFLQKGIERHNNVSEVICKFLLPIFL